jgi:murein L,D-transpeptidase YcbB/YkuD
MLLYFTAEADADGVTFRRDVYGRDGRVLAGLARAPRFTRIDP